MSKLGWLEPITVGLGQAGAGFSVLCRRKAAVNPKYRMRKCPTVHE
ncbi:hypothetical protein RBY4I_894 [Rhodobacterales bacterium Y4I]|nr:hypothetical protein RBY4I_894 [Rhodobacterales bacterium Y4I]